MSKAGPKRMLPHGTVDTHFHLFGPAAHYPYAGGRSYTPVDAGLDAYLAMAARLGISRAVIVQPSPYGTDNRRLLDGLAQSPIPMRGVVVVDDSASDSELAAMHQQGVRGIRINLVFSAGQGIATAIDLAPRLRALGWHIQFLVDVSDWSGLRETVARLGVPAVFDHIGHVPAERSVDDKGFKDLLSLLRDGLAWVKLSGTYRMTQALVGPPYLDVRPFFDAAIASNRNQVLWATDWPHSSIQVPLPEDVDLASMALDWIGPDATLRKSIFVDNSERLYGFKPV